MAKVRFHPLFEHLRGTIKGMVFRLSHNGKISAYLSPDMSQVGWSKAQDAHRERMAEAWRTPVPPTKIRSSGRSMYRWRLSRTGTRIARSIWRLRLLPQPQ